jgi:hypothetical protein
VAKLKEPESSRDSMVLANKTKFDECALHMSNNTTSWTKYVVLLDECDELQPRSNLLGDKLRSRFISSLLGGTSFGS